MPTGYQIMWVGWNSQGNHDKIWGWLKMADGRIYAFWGRRGKKLRFKQHDREWDVRLKVDEKRFKKGYDMVLPSRYDELVKDFLDEVEIWCTTAILADEVM
jgi:hypothetical protein